ncbi:unnamed protein product, partial [Amoebophrya sp. A25]
IYLKNWNLSCTCSESCYHRPAGGRVSSCRWSRSTTQDDNQSMSLVIKYRDVTNY